MSKRIGINKKQNDEFNYDCMFSILLFSTDIHFLVLFLKLNKTMRLYVYKFLSSPSFCNNEWYMEFKTNLESLFMSKRNTRYQDCIVDKFPFYNHKKEELQKKPTIFMQVGEIDIGYCYQLDNSYSTLFGLKFMIVTSSNIFDISPHAFLIWDIVAEALMLRKERIENEIKNKKLNDLLIML